MISLTIENETFYVNQAPAFWVPRRTSVRIENCKFVNSKDRKVR